MSVPTTAGSVTESQFATDIVLGRKYRDEQTGLVGIATAVTFHQHACERVLIEYVKEGELKELVFDAPRLVDVESGVQATTEKTGGPDHSATRRDTAMRR